jgi:hypothetical protein
MKDKLTTVSALIDPNILGASDHAKPDAVNYEHQRMHEKT